MTKNDFNAIFNEEKEMTWTTWDGVTKKLSEIDHQHLSNIHYFMKYISPGYYQHKIKFAMTAELFSRFNGVLLPYCPIGTYKPEIDILKRNGWLVKNDLHNHYDIIIFGKKIGEYKES